MRYFLIFAAACLLAVLSYGPVGSSGPGGRLEAAEATNRDAEAAGLRGGEQKVAEAQTRDAQAARETTELHAELSKIDLAMAHVKLEQARATLGDAEQRFRAGQAQAIDVTMAKCELQLAELQVKAAQARLAQSQLAARGPASSVLMTRPGTPATTDEPKGAEATREAAELRVELSKIELEMAKVGLKQARAKLEDSEQRFGDGGARAIDVKLSRCEDELAQLRIKAAEVRLAQALLAAKGPASGVSR